MTMEKYTYIVESKPLGTQEFDSYASMERYLRTLLSYGESEVSIKKKRW